MNGNCNTMDKRSYEKGYADGLQDAAYTIIRTMKSALNKVEDDLAYEHIEWVEGMLDYITDKFDVEYDEECGL